MTTRGTALWFDTLEHIASIISSPLYNLYAYEQTLYFAFSSSPSLPFLSPKLFILSPYLYLLWACASVSDSEKLHFQTRFPNCANLCGQQLKLNAFSTFSLSSLQIPLMTGLLLWEFIWFTSSISDLNLSTVARASTTEHVPRDPIHTWGRTEEDFLLRFRISYKA